MKHYIRLSDNPHEVFLLPKLPEGHSYIKDILNVLEPSGISGLLYLQDIQTGYYYKKGCSDRKQFSLHTWEKPNVSFVENLLLIYQLKPNTQDTNNTENWKIFTSKHGSNRYDTDDTSTADLYKECVIRHPESKEFIEVKYVKETQSIDLKSFRLVVSIEKAIDILTIWLEGGSY